MQKMEVKGLSKIYFGGYEGFKNVSFELQSGEVFCLFGKADAGKTSTLRTIAGLEEASGGEVLIDGEGFFAKKISDRNVSFLLPAKSLKKRKSVSNTLAYPLKIRNCDPKYIKERVEFVSKCFGIYDFLDYRIIDINDKTQALVALARVFVREGGIILLDEPLRSFEPSERAEIAAVLRSAIGNCGGIVLYATDCLDEVSELSCNIGVMVGGDFVQSGTLDKIFSAPACLAVQKLCRRELNTIKCILRLNKNDISEAVISIFGKELPVRVNLLSKVYDNKEVLFTFLPNSAKICSNGSFSGEVLRVRNYGDSALIDVLIKEEIIVIQSTDFNFLTGDKLRFDITLKDNFFFDKANEFLIGKTKANQWDKLK